MSPLLSIAARAHGKSCERGPHLTLSQVSRSAPRTYYNTTKRAHVPLKRRLFSYRYNSALVSIGNLARVSDTLSALSPNLPVFNLSRENFLLLSE